jgi:hypothetical protein
VVALHPGLPNTDKTSPTALLAVDNSMTAMFAVSNSFSFGASVAI